MSDKELKELMSIICEGQDSEQRRKVENFIEYQVQLIDSLDKEIERLNNDIKELLKENSNKEKVIKIQDNIINKANEYIKVCKSNDMGIRYQRIEEILQGSDKE